MSNEQKASELKAKAARYRALAQQSNDGATAHEKFALSAELEQQARDFDRAAKAGGRSDEIWTASAIEQTAGKLRYNVPRSSSWSRH